MAVLKKVLGLVFLLGLILGTKDGYLALWQEKTNIPQRIFPCPVALLPQADQQALSRGIPVSDQEELARLLEDFMS